MMSETEKIEIEEEVEIVITEVESGFEDEFETPQKAASEASKKEPEKKEVKEQPIEKEVAYNDDAIAKIEKEKVETEKPCFPSFFIEEDDTQDIKIDILANKETGKIVSVSRADLVDLDQFEFLHKSVESFTFTIPTYDDMSKYRQQSQSFNKEANRSIIDNVQLRHFYLVWHLRDWTLRDNKGKKVELEHDESGALSDDSIKKVYKVPASLLDVVLTIFEKDVLVS